jgi:hypothetical protein
MVRFEVGTRVARDEEEWELGALLFHPVGYLAAAQDRHHEIADHEAHGLSLKLQQSDGGGAVGRLEHPLAALPQGPSDQSPDDVFVVYDQYRVLPRWVGALTAARLDHRGRGCAT